MELTIHVDPAERTVRFREVHALAAGDSCSVVLEGVRGADVASLRLALYRDAASDSPVASCPSFAPVHGHPNLATGDLRLDTAEMAAWFEAAVPADAQAESGPGRSRPEDAAERAVRTDGWLVVSDPERTWAACRVPVILRPGAGISDVVDPTSLQALVEGLVSAAMSEAPASTAHKPPTLAGYGITDAAAKSELDSVDQNVANAISGVQLELSAKADLVDGKVPVGQLPPPRSSVLEYDAASAFPSTGEGGRIYVAKDTNKTYSWDGTQYVELSQSLALGETSETAYPGDKGAANASGIAALKKSKQDALDAKQLSAVNSGITAEKISDMVTKDDVVPKGSGTETIATIGGKDIKAPASPVSSVNGKTGAVKLVAQDVGALPLAGGTLTGDLVIGDKERPASRKLTVEADGGANGIQLTGGNVGSGSSMTIGGSSGPGGTLVVEDGGSGNASIKKGGKEVATEAYVDDKVKNAVLPTDPTFSNSVLAAGLNIDTNSVAVLNEIASTFGGFPIEGTATTVGGLSAALAAAVAWLKRNKQDKLTKDSTPTVGSMLLMGDRTSNGVSLGATSEGSNGALAVRGADNLTSVLTPDGSPALTQILADARYAKAGPSGAGDGYVVTIVDLLASNGIYSPAGLKLLDSRGGVICDMNVSGVHITIKVRDAYSFGSSAASEHRTTHNSGVIGCFAGVSSVSAVHVNDGSVVAVYLSEDGGVRTLTGDSSIQLTSDAIVVFYEQPYCLSPDTPILMADGTNRPLSDIRVGDRVSCIDPETGLRSWDEVVSVSSGNGLATDVWTFDDGSEVRTVGRHRFWNEALGEFMYLEAWNMGESAVRSDGGKVHLVGHSRVEGTAPHMTLFTRRYNNYFAGGLLAGNRRSQRLRLEGGKSE